MARKLNNSRIREYDARVYEPSPIFQTKDGGETLNIEEAYLSNGKPIILGYSKKESSIVPIPESKLTIDPEDPLAMSNAMADLGRFENINPELNYYGDKFDAITRINGIAAKAVENKEKLV